MKKYTSLIECFNATQKQIIKAGITVEPGDAYLAYCAMALCTIADKMADAKPENRPCDGCKHCVWPDGDSTCVSCSYYYDSKFEEGKP